MEHEKNKMLNPNWPTVKKKPNTFRGVRNANAALKGLRKLDRLLGKGESQK